MGNRHQDDRNVLSPGLLADFRLLVLLFVILRLALGMVYQPTVFERYTVRGEAEAIERGMSTFGDLRYFHEVASVTDQGEWPYRDFWFEFPPVWTLLFIGLYRVSETLGTVAYSHWATIIGLFMTLVDVGNITLLRRLARHLYGEDVAISLAWVYALLVIPLVMLWWNFEPLVILLLLLALWWLVTARATRSAFAVAVGVLTKYIAVLILPAIWRFRSRRYAVRYTALSLMVPVVVLGLLVAWGGETAQVSLIVQANKTSHQTVWALLDDNYGTGQFPPVSARYDTATALTRTGNTPVVPAALRLLPFMVLGSLVYVRTKRRDDRALLAFVTLTLTLFFLWAQGWSPQWALTLTPLILLNMPDRTGVLFCVVLGFMSLLEYPVLFSRAAEPGGAISGDLRPMFVMLVVLRTLLVAGFAIALIRQLLGEAQRGST